VSGQRVGAVTPKCLADGRCPRVGELESRATAAGRPAGQGWRIAEGQRVCTARAGPNLCSIDVAARVVGSLSRSGDLPV
jgi:hypothetical protein